MNKFYFSASTATRYINLLWLALIALFITACSSMGSHQKPQLDLPATWNAPPGVPASHSRWWALYHDAILDRLVDEALTNNADLQLAAARVAEARAQLSLARADQFPEAGIRAGRSRTRSSELGSMPLPPDVDPLSNSNRATLNISYEIDLWGKYAKATDAARSELLATEAARETVRVSLISQVVQAYVGLRALADQVSVGERTIASRQQALDLQNKRYTAGLISQYDLKQSEAELAAAQALLPGFARQRAQQENILNVLLGRSPAQSAQEKIEPGVVVHPVAIVVPPGLPSELLLRRPDLKEAEQRLNAAQARIDVARAAYFPSISLTGFLGGESASLADLFTAPARIWQVAAGLTQPLFGAGRIGRQVDVASAREQQALAAYQLAVQNAFREVRDAVTAQTSALAQLQAEQRRVSILTEALQLARLRYENGVASLLEVLDAERNILQAELNRLDAERAQRVAIAELFKALGGGW